MSYHYIESIKSNARAKKAGFPVRACSSHQYDIRCISTVNTIETVSGRLNLEIRIYNLFCVESINKEFQN